MAELRHLVVVLGSQLDIDAAAFDSFGAGHDAVWMAEVDEESTGLWSGKPRTALFLAAMRHFAQALRAAGRPLHDTRLDDANNPGSLHARLHADIERLRPSGLVMTAPGDWRVLQAIKGVAQAHVLPLDIREMRKRHGVLMDGEASAGGQWNFDTDNRVAFGARGLGTVQPRAVFEPDAITREVIALLDVRFANHTGRLDSLAWPVTRQQAPKSRQRFIAEHLPLFGRHQAALAGNPRRALQVKNVAPPDDVQKQAIRQRAAAIRSSEIA